MSNSPGSHILHSISDHLCRQAYAQAPDFNQDFVLVLYVWWWCWYTQFALVAAYLDYTGWAEARNGSRKDLVHKGGFKHVKKEITYFVRKPNLHQDLWLFHATPGFNWKKHMRRCPSLSPAPFLSLISLRNSESDKKRSPQEQVGHTHPDSPWYTGWTSYLSKNKFTHSSAGEEARHKNLPVVHILFIATTTVRAQVFLATRKAQSEFQPSVWGLGNFNLCQLLNFK